MSILFPLVRPILHAMDAETAHHMTLKALKCGLYPKDRKQPHPSLKQTVFGLHFTSPVGMAAGFDKNAEALDGLLAYGFGFVEAGTVTPKPQEGNPRPRIFRDAKSRSVINRMGFPGGGADVFMKNYQSFRQHGRHRHGIIGINIGKNKDTAEAIDDYTALIETPAPYADYLTVNISSHNTPGLRDLQKREHLLPLLEAMKTARAKACTQMKVPPLLVKLAPDLNVDDCAAIAQTVMDAEIDGLVLSNTTLDRPADLPGDFRSQTGGLSGPHVRHKSTDIIGRFYKLTDGKLPIIGVGGISSGADAYAKIRAGASLVQLYTALVFEGPGLVKRIHDEIADLLKRDGFRNISSAIGADHK